MSKTDKSTPKHRDNKTDQNKGNPRIWLERSQTSSLRYTPLTLQCFTVFRCLNKVPIGCEFLSRRLFTAVDFYEFTDQWNCKLRLCANVMVIYNATHRFASPTDLVCLWLARSQTYRLRAWSTVKQSGRLRCRRSLNQVVSTSRKLSVCVICSTNLILESFYANTQSR